MPSLPRKTARSNCSPSLARTKRRLARRHANGSLDDMVQYADVACLPRDKHHLPTTPTVLPPPFFAFGGVRVLRGVLRW